MRRMKTRRQRILESVRGLALEHESSPEVGASKRISKNDNSNTNH